MTEPIFLSVDDVLGLHQRQIERYDGKIGVRDLGLLQSAVAAPQASFGGAWLQPTLPEMAAAYLFHLSQNHPFIDGNKRTAAVSMLVFLRLNDLTPTFTEDELFSLTMLVAAGSLTQAEAALDIMAHIE